MDEPSPHVNLSPGLPVEKIIIIEESTFPCLNAIPKITWGSFRGQRDKMPATFRGRDHFRVGDLFGVGIIFGGCTVSGENLLGAGARFSNVPETFRA